ncbi:MAG: hypothetical protein KY397_04810, partial [Gemmatimonadetes bacterium]|nr:hypothetical protein [Gemmatimonadota bacterium]
EAIAERAVGMTGADLAGVVNEAGLLAARADQTEIAQTHLVQALERVMEAPERQRRLSMRDRSVGQRTLGEDRTTFADVAGAVSRTSTDIKSADLTVTETGIEGTFVVEVKDLEHLNKVIGAMKSIDGILEVERREYFGTHSLEPEPGRVVGG